MKAPTIREEDITREAAKAKWWRLHVANLTIEQLASITGYSARAIYYMELGCNSQGKKIRPWVWNRYKLACAYADWLSRGGISFNWGQ